MELELTPLGAVVFIFIVVDMCVHITWKGHMCAMAHVMKTMESLVHWVTSYIFVGSRDGM